MAKSGCFRGVMGAMVLCCLPGAALAAPKTGAAGAGGAPAVAATPAGGTAPTASAATPATPPTDAAPVTVPAPTAAPDPSAAPPAEVAPAPAVAPAADAEEEEAPAPRRKHKKKAKRRHHHEEDEDEGEGSSEEEDSHWTSPNDENENGESHGATWRAADTSFIISAERLTGFATWNTSTTIPATNNGFGGVSGDTTLEDSGTDFSFLGTGMTGSAFAIPRLGFDGRFSNGLTLGGSLSYMVRSSKSTSKQGTLEESSDGPTQAIFLFAPRLGVLFEASPMVSLWLRGGITRLSIAEDRTDQQFINGNPVTFTENKTTTLVAVSLDPQLVLTPAPHVGITLGVNLDFGVSGTVESSASSSSSSASSPSSSRDTSLSSYGASAGLIAMF